MEKNSYPTSKQENTTICEKLIRVINSTSPFRATRFGSNNRVHQETPPTTPRNVSLMTRTPERDRCTRISSTNLTPLKDCCLRRPVENKRESDHIVPILFLQSEDHSNGPGRKINQNNVSFAPITSADEISPKDNSQPVLPIYGVEHRVPSMSKIGEKSLIGESINGLFTEYIDRAGRKIRSPTIVGVTGMSHDSFNDKVSDFINRAKHKFHNTPSLVDSSFKEKRVN